jgi:hypothetical protein
MSDPDQQFLSFVEAALKASGLADTTFGLDVCGDPNFIRELRGGRECRRATRQNLTRVIEEKFPTRKRGKAA